MTVNPTTVLTPQMRQSRSSSRNFGDHALVIVWAVVPAADGSSRAVNRKGNAEMEGTRLIGPVLSQIRAADP